MTQLTTLAGALTKALKLADRVTETRNTVPILSCVKIDGNAVRATDLDLDLEVSFPASETTEPFLVHLPSTLALLRHVSPDTEITLTVRDNTVTLAFPGARYVLNSLPASDWQDLTLPKTKPKVLVAGNLGLADAFKRTRHSISTEETRYYLNGACLSSWPDDRPCIVTTDGHRMSIVDVPGASHFDGQIIPRKAIETLLRIGDPTEVHFWPKDSYMRFKFAGATLTTRLIDGSFPDWGRVVPKLPASAARLKLDTGAASTIRRIASISTDRSRAIGLHFKAGAVYVGLEHHERGLGVEKLSHTAFANPENAPETIGLNANYLLDANKVHGLDVGEFVFSGDSGSPLMTESDGAVGVLMPLRFELGNAASSLIEEMVA